MKAPSFLVATLLIATPFMQAASSLEPGDAIAASTFSLAHQAQVPGEVLKPGDYSIQIVEHISDRMILRIDSVQGKEHFLFLGVPSLDSNSTTAAPGVQTWRSGTGSLPTLRGFNFPTGTAVDFVYPKADAAALAKANAATIIAIDPASEGRPTKLTNLSSDDMREINLWMLTLTSTGPADHAVPALEAKRYQVPASQVALNPTTPSRTESPVRTSASSTAPQSQLAKLDQPAAPQRAVTRSKAVGKELPHTASLMPTIWLLGCMSFFLAALSFILRKLSSSASLRS